MGRSQTKEPSGGVGAGSGAAVGADVAACGTSAETADARSAPVCDALAPREAGAVGSAAGDSDSDSDSGSEVDSDATPVARRGSDSDAEASPPRRAPVLRAADFFATVEKEESKKGSIGTIHSKRDIPKPELDEYEQERLEKEEKRRKGQWVCQSHNCSNVINSKCVCPVGGVSAMRWVTCGRGVYAGTRTSAKGAGP